MSNKIKVFILHHIPAKDRKIKLQGDLNKINLKYPVEWVEQFLPSEVDSNINYSIKINELSLSLKHQYALQQIVENNITYGIIFEDDIDLNCIPSIQEFLEQSIFELGTSQGDILWIGDAWVGKYVIPSNKKESHKLSYFCYNCCSRCTHAYIVTKRGAKLVLDNYHYNQPVDHFFNEIISSKKILPGWTEPGLTQKSAENIWPGLI